MRVVLPVALFVVNLAWSFEGLAFKDTEITDLAKSGNGQIILLNRRVVVSKKFVPGLSRVFFRDLLPGANWAHDAEIRVIDQTGGVLEVIKVSNPPASARERVSPKPAGVMGPELPPVSFNVQPLGVKYAPENSSHLYALLINGNADQRHRNDFSFLYRVLTVVYRYNPKNIFVLDSQALKKNPDLDGDGRSDVQFKSDRATYKAVLSDLKSKLKSTDFLFIAVNDHGDRSPTGAVSLVLEDSLLGAPEMGKDLKSLRVGAYLAIFQQCYSGGFLKSVLKQGSVGMAAASHRETSWASQDLLFNEFIYHLISAFAGQTHDGRLLNNVDLNKDRKISAHEAFAYALSKKTRPEHPVLETYPNKGTDFELGLFGGISP